MSFADELSRDVDEVCRDLAAVAAVDAGPPPPVDILATIRRLSEPTHTVFVPPGDLDAVAARAPFGVEVVASEFVAPGTAIMVDRRLAGLGPVAAPG